MNSRNRTKLYYMMLRGVVLEAGRVELYHMNGFIVKRIYDDNGVMIRQSRFKDIEEIYGVNFAQIKVKRGDN